MLPFQRGHISAPAAMGTLWEGLAAPLLELGAGPGPGLRWVCAARVRTLQITFGRAGGGGMAAGVGGPTVFISFHALYIGGDGGVLGVPVSGVLFWVSLRGEGLCRLLHLCDVVCACIFFIGLRAMMHSIVLSWQVAHGRASFCHHSLT